MPKEGQAVKYVDEHGVEHDALITKAWGAECVNVVFVSGNEAETDQYGRQVKRETSCMHKSVQQAPGRYWY